MKEGETMISKAEAVRIFEENAYLLSSNGVDRLPDFRALELLGDSVAEELAEIRKKDGE